MSINIRNFVIIAHIDHGKSTLADRFLELTKTIHKNKMQAQALDTMDLERERGITIKMQPVTMQHSLDGGDYTLNLIDTPGHMDFAYEVERSLAAVEGAILLVDATQGIQAQTLANLYLAKKHKLKIIPVLNKIDLPTADVETHTRAFVELLDCKPEEILAVSAKEGTGVEELLGEVIRKVPGPNLEETHTRALIFDSYYDNFKGVVCHVRLFGGELSKQKVKFVHTGALVDLLEVGQLKPALTKTPALTSGNIGYIATGIKEPDQVTIGDTIVEHDNTDTKPLEGYREPRPVLYAGVFPEEGDDFELMKDVMMKLRLNDTAVVYQPTSHPAFGKGLSVGFLGMLHMEIILERIRREFNLQVIVTTPSPRYQIMTTAGEVEEITSAADLPAPEVIETLEEPWVNLRILAPLSYQGKIMKLIPQYRCVFKEIHVVNEQLATFEFDAPLAEIIQDFNDKLKSVTEGYASFSYEPIGYRGGDLVRLAILIAGEEKIALSRIVAKEKAYATGHEVLIKLKEELPKQQFMQALQAKVGGKIIARENISAMRKDVTAKLYGGDVTRKNKLLDKQKKGKKKMKQLGTVKIPSDVYMKILKR